MLSFCCIRSHTRTHTPTHSYTFIHIHNLRHLLVPLTHRSLIIIWTWVICYMKTECHCRGRTYIDIYKFLAGSEWCCVRRHIFSLFRLVQFHICFLMFCVKKHVQTDMTRYTLALVVLIIKFYCMKTWEKLI